MGNEQDKEESPEAQLTPYQMETAMILMKREIVELISTVERVIHAFSTRIAIQDTILVAYTEQYPLTRRDGTPVEETPADTATTSPSPSILKLHSGGYL